MVGIKGIIVRETKRTFVVIQKDNQVKSLVKEGSVFQLKLPDTVKSSDDSKSLRINIWGDNIKYAGSERGKIKFKEKYNLELY